MSVPVGKELEVGPQVNNFEQVSSDNHQISVAGGGRGAMSRGVSRGEGVGPNA